MGFDWIIKTNDYSHHLRYSLSLTASSLIEGTIVCYLPRRIESTRILSCRYYWDQPSLCGRGTSISSFRVILEWDLIICCGYHSAGPGLKEGVPKPKCHFVKGVCCAPILRLWLPREGPSTWFVCAVSGTVFRILEPVPIFILVFFHNIIWCIVRYWNEYPSSSIIDRLVRLVCNTYLFILDF